MLAVSFLYPATVQQNTDGDLEFYDLGLDPVVDGLLDQLDFTFAVSGSNDSLTPGDPVTINLFHDTETLDLGFPFGSTQVTLSGGGTATYLGKTDSGDLLVDVPAANPVTVTVDANSLDNPLFTFNDTIQLDGQALLIRSAVDDGDGELVPPINTTDDFDAPALPDDATEFANAFEGTSFTGFDPSGFGTMDVDPLAAGSPYATWTEEVTIAVDFDGFQGDLNTGDLLTIYFTAKLTSPDVPPQTLEIAPVIAEVEYLGQTPEGGLVLSGITDVSDDDGEFPTLTSPAILTQPNGSGAPTVTIVGTYEFGDFYVTDAGFPASGSVQVSSAPLYICFGAGTLIATPSGEVAVETLSIGDPVVTAEGDVVPVKWLGRQTVHHRFGPAERLAPVVIEAGALQDGVPHSDLTVTADHGIIVDGLVIHAGALVNGDTIRRVPLSDLPPTRVVYHIETEGHHVVLANGAPAETFIDNVTRRCFDNFAEYAALYGDGSEIAPLDLPRVKGPRQVPLRVRQRLARKTTDAA